MHRDGRLVPDPKGVADLERGPQQRRHRVVERRNADTSFVVDHDREVLRVRVNVADQRVEHDIREEDDQVLLAPETFEQVGEMPQRRWLGANSLVLHAPAACPQAQGLEEIFLMQPIDGAETLHPIEAVHDDASNIARVTTSDSAADRPIWRANARAACSASTPPRCTA